MSQSIIAALDGLLDTIADLPDEARAALPERAVRDAIEARSQLARVKHWLERAIEVSNADPDDSIRDSDAYRVSFMREMAIGSLEAIGGGQ